MNCEVKNSFVLVGAAFSLLIAVSACESKDAPAASAAQPTAPASPAAPASKPAAAAEPTAATPTAATPGAATGTPAAQGKAIYTKVCVACHSIDGSKLVGPTMKGMYGRKVKGTNGDAYVLDDAGITQSIKEPMKNIAAGYPPAMVLPAPLSDADIKNVIAYLKTIK